MQRTFEYKTLYLPGAEPREPDRGIGEEDILHLLRERTRVYNRVGAEGWELVAEHQDPVTYAVVATFRQAGAVEPRAVDATPPEAAAAPAPSDDGVPGARAYPVLQPNAVAPNSFRVVWDP